MVKPLRPSVSQQIVVNPSTTFFMLTTHSKFRPIKYHEMELSNTDVEIFQTYECYAAHPATMFFRRVQGFLQNDRG